MAGLVPYFVLLWIPVTLALFARGPRAWAVVLSCVLGTLFLPEVQSHPVAKVTVTPLKAPMLEFTKVNAIAYGLLLAWLAFDARRFAEIRWNIWDLPALGMSVVPAISMSLHGESFDKAFAELRAAALVWGVPYLVGRVYLSDVQGVWRVLCGLALGGILYVPFCLFEMRMSPQLHNIVYGYHQHEFAQTYRLGSYRPMVFMQHGLSVAFWMVAASLSLWQLCRTGCWPLPELPAFIGRFPRIIQVVVIGTTLAIRSFGARALGAAGYSILVMSEFLRTRFFLMILIAIPPLYATSRALGTWKAQDLVGVVGKNVEEERGESLAFRLYMEEKLIKKLEGHEIWGTGAKVRPVDEKTQRLIIPDGQWIITYYDNGVVGLVCLLGLFLGPPYRFLRLHSAASWGRAPTALAAVAAMILTLFMIDCLFNAMLTPVYVLLAAALNGCNNGVAGAMSANVAR